jgi:hypothetical protein
MPVKPIFDGIRTVAFMKMTRIVKTGGEAEKVEKPYIARC